MRLRIETIAERVERIREWHRWFAWHPVCVGRSDSRWLETVERRRDWDRDGGFWEYRIASPTATRMLTKENQ